MNEHAWPDPLEPPDPQHIERQLAIFWEALAALAGLLPQDEMLLAAEVLAEARAIVVELMLALNGIARPAGTRHLNAYLSAAQRTALQKTLVAPDAEAGAWIGQAVALVVIYRWYAPQLVARYGVDYPVDLEQQVWSHLAQSLPAWPQAVTTE